MKRVESARVCTSNNTTANFAHNLSRLPRHEKITLFISEPLQAIKFVHLIAGDSSALCCVTNRTSTKIVLTEECPIPQRTSS